MPNKAKEAATSAPADTTEPAEKPVKVVVREMFEAGKSRSEIAKELGISYQRVFSLTKGQTNASTAEPGGTRPKVILGPDVADGRFDGVARIEAIRTLFGEGLKVGEIAKLLGTSYQIVFQATRALREQAAAAAEVAEEADGDVEESEVDDDDDDVDEDEDEDEE